MLQANQYLNELQEGVKIQGKNTSVGSFYGSIAIAAQVSPGTSVFPNTIVTSGSIVGFFTVAGSTVTGVATLFSTTSGTIAAITYGSTVGLVTGTAVLLASFNPGDQVLVTNSTAGSVTCYVAVQTAL